MGGRDGGDGEMSTVKPSLESSTFTERRVLVQGHLRTPTPYDTRAFGVDVSPVSERPDKMDSSEAHVDRVVLSLRCKDTPELFSNYFSNKGCLTCHKVLWGFRTTSGPPIVVGNDGNRLTRPNPLR